MAAFVRLYRQKRDSPRETTESFEGRTVLITGATSGLGLAAAQKLVVLNVSRLIITARTVEKGEGAKRQIEQYVEDHHRESGVTSARSAPPTDIVVLALDMTTQAGVRAFVAELENRLTGLSSRSSPAHLNAAILNAGVTQKAYHQSPDGYEETIQINTISTTLLALLILPLLKASSSSSAGPDRGGHDQTRQQQQTPHLLFVSSGTVLGITRSSMEQLINSPNPIKALSDPASFPSNSRGGMKQYARSKLLLEHIMRRMASMPSLYDTGTETDGNGGQADVTQTRASKRSPRVVISSTCPGLCATSLGRQYTDASHRWLITRMLIRMLMYIFTTFFARTAHQGANSYISALTLGEQDGAHGQLWKNDRMWRGKELGEMIGDELVKEDREAGRTGADKEASVQEIHRFGDNVWSEVLEIIGKDATMGQNG